MVQASRIIKKEEECYQHPAYCGRTGCSSASMYRYFQNLDELCSCPAGRAQRVYPGFVKMKRSGMTDI